MNPVYKIHCSALRVVNTQNLNFLISLTLVYHRQDHYLHKNFLTKHLPSLTMRLINISAIATLLGVVTGAIIPQTDDNKGDLVNTSNPSTALRAR